MKLAPDAQAELDRHPSPEMLRALICKAGKVCVSAAELETEALSRNDLHGAAYLADVQERWATLAFAAAERVAKREAQMQALRMSGALVDGVMYA